MKIALQLCIREKNGLLVEKGSGDGIGLLAKGRSKPTNTSKAIIGCILRYRPLEMGTECSWTIFCAMRKRSKTRCVFAVMNLCKGALGRSHPEKGFVKLSEGCLDVVGAWCLYCLKDTITSVWRSLLYF